MAKEKIKKKIALGDSKKPRVVFCRSNRHIRVQAVDDEKYNTLVYFSSEQLSKELGSDSKEQITNKKKESKNKSKKNFSFKNKDFVSKIAKKFASELKNKGYRNIIFDRNGNKYHGCVKLFCDIMRESGIVF